jgi:hypothetical protein
VLLFAFLSDFVFPVAGLPRFLFREFDFAQLLGAFCEF